MTTQRSPEFQLEFLDYIQRLLDEGGFVATYKYALLMALADLSVEMGDDSGTTLELRVDDIARKFIQYYSRQTVPYPAKDNDKVLHQNTGKQARIVNLVAEAQAPYLAGGKPIPVARLTSSKPLVAQVASTVATMPLWKLQVLGNTDHPFLYPQTRTGRVITLNPGVAYCFRRFHGFVTRLAQDAWLRHVRGVPGNRDILGSHADLSAFLFGTPRAQLAQYRPVLEEIQGCRCFYCCAPRRATEVDHFIPWSWYSIDLGHNFVLACPQCNAAKRDSLAALCHLRKWAGRNEERGQTMGSMFGDRGLPHDLQATTTVAQWAYGRTHSRAGAVWVRADKAEPLTAEWALILKTQ